LSFDLVIMDFDGTCTDVETEGGPFLEAYRADAAQMLGEGFAEDWDRAAELVRSEPEVHGWRYEGRVVAPGNADPYLRATVIMNMIFDRRGLYPDPEARTELLQELYSRHYVSAATAFREDARRVIETILASELELVIVTNSDTEAVRGKVTRLAPKGQANLLIRGNARKFILAEPEVPDPRFDSLPREQRYEGLERPILLRRGHYFEVLREVWSQKGTSPERTLIVGDIFELDIAMPFFLGAHGHLIAGPNTPSFERRAMQGAARGAVSETLEPVLERLGLR